MQMDMYTDVYCHMLQFRLSCKSTCERLSISIRPNSMEKNLSAV